MQAEQLSGVQRFFFVKSENIHNNGDGVTFSKREMSGSLIHELLHCTRLHSFLCQVAPTDHSSRGICIVRTTVNDLIHNLSPREGSRGKKRASASDESVV